MDLEVLLEIALVVGGGVKTAQLLCHGTELVDIFGREGRQGLAEGEDVEGPDDLVELPHFFFGRVLDEDFLAGVDDEILLRGQPEERFTDGRRRRVEERGDLFFLEPLPGFDIAVDEAFESM
jgi:hypothetical protein